jgi:hypothetical protein
MDLPIAALAAGGAGWRDAHDAVHSRSLAVPDAVEESGGPVHAYAAARARDYARVQAAALELTRREFVVLWHTYRYAYLRGAIDAASESSSDPHP